MFMYSDFHAKAVSDHAPNSETLTLFNIWYSDSEMLEWMSFDARRQIYIMGNFMFKIICYLRFCLTLIDYAKVGYHYYES